MVFVGLILVEEDRIIVSVVVVRLLLLLLFVFVFVFGVLFIFIVQPVCRWVLLLFIQTLGIIIIKGKEASQYHNNIIIYQQHTNCNTGFSSNWQAFQKRPTYNCAFNLMCGILFHCTSIPFGLLHHPGQRKGLTCTYSNLTTCRHTYPFHYPYHPFHPPTADHHCAYVKNKRMRDIVEYWSLKMA